jgi:hypothetical protein
MTDRTVVRAIVARRMPDDEGQHQTDSDTLDLRFFCFRTDRPHSVGSLSITTTDIARKRTRHISNRTH